MSLFSLVSRTSPPYGIIVQAHARRLAKPRQIGQPSLGTRITATRDQTSASRHRCVRWISLPHSTGGSLTLLRRSDAAIPPSNRLRLKRQRSTSSGFSPRNRRAEICKTAPGSSFPKPDEALSKLALIRPFIIHIDAPSVAATVTILPAARRRLCSEAVALDCVTYFFDLTPAQIPVLGRQPVVVRPPLTGAG